MPARTRTILLVAMTIFGVLGIGAAVAAVAVPERTAAAVPAIPRAAPAPASTPSGTDEPVDPAAVPISQLPDPAWVTRVAKSVGIPQRALAAYAGAALVLSDTVPSCGIGWSTLAGIGYVESQHGTLGGGQIDADGIARPRIVGVALDGRDVATITDTDNGSLDGDTQYDRAVGPMQFIPTSWQTLGRDGNRDGDTNVNDIDDAALAAGTHLCDIGGDLTQSKNWIAAIAAYNDSVEYNNAVADAAEYYAKVR